MLALVVINTITIFIGGYGKAARTFFWIDSLFTLIFVVEVLVKIKTYGWKDYWSENWNKFDFIITLIAVPSLLNIFVETGLATSVILSLRSLRIFKSFRLLKFIPNISGLLKGVGLAVKASFIVSIAFAVLLLIISILSSTLFGKISPDLFGDPGVSLFTIFRLFTGDGWSEIPVQIAENSSVFIGRLLGLYSQSCFSLEAFWVSLLSIPFLLTLWQATTMTRFFISWKNLRKKLTVLTNPNWNRLFLQHCIKLNLI